MKKPLGRKMGKEAANVVVEDEEEDIRRRKKKNYSRPYRRVTSLESQERGWLETSVRMGLRVPVFCLDKAVTKSDADRAQHRYQLTDNDVKKSKLLFELAARATIAGSVSVNVLDRLGRRYKMDFKHLTCNGYFRFMGDGWTEFLGNTKLKEKQMMTIWAFPWLEEEEDWFALVNNDAEDTLLLSSM